MATYGMADLTLDTMHTMQDKDWTNGQFVHHLARNIMSAYRRTPEGASDAIPDAASKKGFCLAIAPEARLTGSPTGGIVGRYLARSLDHGSLPSMTFGSSGTSSNRSSGNFSTKMGKISIGNDPTGNDRTGNDSIGMPLDLVRGDHALVYDQLAIQLQEAGAVDFGATSSKLETSPTTPPKQAIRQLPANAYYHDEEARHLFAQRPGYVGFAPSNVIPTSSTASGQSSGSKKLSPEDMNFLYMKLEELTGSANSSKTFKKESPMTQLVPVHEDRPGQHILRMHPVTGQLYACIPHNPYAPEPKDGQQEYSLPTYNDYIQDKERGGRRVRAPYPAVGASSLNTCNHCGTPSKVLNNDILCPFHAYYLATGKFLGYYEFCALVEMEKTNLSVMTGWWKIEDMVSFVHVLTEKIAYWELLMSSTPLPKEDCAGKTSPFGALKEPVPQRAEDKTASHGGAEALLKEIIRRTNGSTDLKQVYKVAIAPLYQMRR